MTTEQDREREQRFHDLLSGAVQLAPEKRHAFLRAACGGDQELFDEVWEAVSADDELGDFLEVPAMRLPGLDAEPASEHDAPTASTRGERPHFVDVRTPIHRPGSGPSPRDPETDHPTPTPRTDLTSPPTSVLTRLRTARGFGLFALYLLLVPVLVVAAARGTATLLSAPDVGLSFGSLTGRVATVTSRWPDVERGEEIVAVNGAEMGGDPVRLRAAFLELRPGELTLRLRSGEREHDVSAAIRHRSGVEQAVGWTRVATGASLLLIAALAFVLRPGTPVSWLFLLFSSSLAFHLMIYASLIRRPPDGLVLESVGLYLAAVTGLHLFTVFPARLLRRRWLIALYLPVAAACLTLLVLYRVDAALPVVAGLLTVDGIFAAATSLASVVLVSLQYARARHLDDDVALARSRALVIAVVLGLAIPALLDAMPLFNADLAWAFNSFPVIIFVSIMAYSIIRHNALDVDRFTAAILGYVGTSALLALAFGAVVIGVPALVGAAELFRSPFVVAALTATFFAIFHPIYRRIRKKIDHWYEREQVTEDTALGLLRQLSDSVRTSDLSRTLRVGLETAGSLHGERTEIWSRTPHGSTLTRICSSAETPTPVPVSIKSPLIRALGDGSGGLAGLSDRTLEPAALEELWTRNLALAVPIFANDEMQGFVGLARKRNGMAYTHAERTFLDTVASQLGIAMDRDLRNAERVGPYQVLHRLGTGGMAEVYLAEKHGPGGFDRRVAMKRMLPHLSQDPECVAMFLDEARIAAQLHHPHIVQIYDIEKYDDVYYLAMELIDGPTLSALLRKVRDRDLLLSAQVSTAIAVSVLDALGYAHNMIDRQGQPLGLVHRDVKPANILLSRQGEIKLSDFGIARAEFRLYQTQAGMARGTPAYMAPEQENDGKVTPRVDLYAAGCVIYEMLTGRKAYPDGPGNGEPVPPSYLNSEVPASIDYFARCSLAAEPDKRFATAGEMRDAFLSLITPIEPAGREIVADAIEFYVPESARREPLSRFVP